MNLNTSTSLEIQGSDFTPQQLSLINDRLRRIQEMLTQTTTPTTQTLLTLIISGNLTVANDVAPHATLPGSASVSAIVVQCKTAPSSTVNFRINVSGVIWQASLQASGTYKAITLPTPASMPGNQPITLAILAANGAANMTVTLQGTFS